MKLKIFFINILLSISISPQQREMQFNFYYTGLITAYDLQSNGTPQQIWQDKENPQNVHAVFMHSVERNGWTDRNGKYFFSNDMGVSWSNMGNVQIGPISRGGFPAITGLNDGRPVVGIHNNDSISATRTQVYVRDFSGSSWNRYDPGPAASGEPIWPRVLGVGNNKVMVSSSISGTTDNDFLINILNVPTGIFGGWSSISGEQAETYCIEKSTDESVIGIVNIGSNENPMTFGNLYYRETLDGGLTWSETLEIYHYGSGGDSMGVFRGMDMIFLDNTPYVVFEIVKLNPANIPSDTLPNKIMLWSPALNNGQSFTLVESGADVPFYHNYVASSDYFFPVCRPTIGRSAEGNALFVAMNVVTEHYSSVLGDIISYFAGYIMYSFDGGENWSIPEKFTPVSPVKDWRYVSISPTNSVTDYDCIIQMVIQADTVPGSQHNSQYQWILANAELVFIRGSFFSDAEDLNNPDEFYLSQNYPNPFNPSTKIKYSIASGSHVRISVYNLIGEKIIELVNGYKPAGSYELNIDMSQFNSGIYFYKLETGEYMQVRKMILLK